MDRAAFFGGTWCAAADWFGAHPECGGFRFRLWAPHARAVSLAGDFSGWEPMEMTCRDGVWECVAEEARAYDSYKFCVTQADGKTVWKALRLPYSHPPPDRQQISSPGLCLAGRSLAAEPGRKAPAGAASEYLRGPPGLLAPLRRRQPL